MRAVRCRAGVVEVVDVDEPGGEGARVHVASASICGTDLKFVEQGGLPFTLGHEFAGTLDDGTTVAVEPCVRCGTCDQCRSGNYQRCSTMAASSFMGVLRDGGLAERIVVPEQCLVPLSPTVDVGNASLVEPLAVAAHGLRLAHLSEGMRVLVVGGGSIGLAAVAAAASRDVEVALEARYPHQVEAGERLGAAQPAGSFDVVIEAAGSPSALARSAEAVEPGGTILVLGFHPDALVVPGVPALLKEIRVVSSYAYCGHEHGRDFEDAAAMLAARPEIADTLLTHRFPLEEAPEAFRVAADRSGGVIKVAIDIT